MYINMKDERWKSSIKYLLNQTLPHLSHFKHVIIVDQVLDTAQPPLCKRKQPSRCKNNITSLGKLREDKLVCAWHLTIKIWSP